MDYCNSVLVIDNVLSPTECAQYLEKAVNVYRPGGKSAFGRTKPRKEVCYTPHGLPYKYSGILHTSAPFPPHVLTIVPTLQSYIQALVPDNVYTELSNGVDIVYSAEFERGGSISAHSDDEDEWGLVIILSFGQTRWLRVRNKYDKTWYNVELKHNSLVAMHGATFQRDYTHQIDKLAVGETPAMRMSLNIRFK